jgi:hypothetical protein
MSEPMDPELLDILIRVQTELFMILTDELEPIESPRHRKLLRGIIGEISHYVTAQSPTLSDDKP